MSAQPSAPVADTLPVMLSPSTDALWRSLAALVVTCLLLVGVLWLVQRGRRGPQGTAGPLRLLARLPLFDGHVVYLLEAAGRQILVGGGPGGLTLLGELPAAPATTVESGSVPS